MSLSHKTSQGDIASAGHRRAMPAATSGARCADSRGYRGDRPAGRGGDAEGRPHTSAGYKPGQGRGLDGRTEKGRALKVDGPSVSGFNRSRLARVTYSQLTCVKP